MGLTLFISMYPKLVTHPYSCLDGLCHIKNLAGEDLHRRPFRFVPSELSSKTREIQECTS